MKPELDKAIAAANAHTRLERDEEYGGMICAECGFSLGALPIESDARFRHGMEAAALVLLYALLVLRGFRVAILARTPYAQLLAGGLALSLGVQALVIIGGVLRLIPLTGITLPFLSYGGTSIVTSAAAVGLLLRLSAEAA